MEKPKKHPLLRAADIEAAHEPHAHPWNANSEIRGVRLGHRVGLERTGVNLLRIAPGKESFVYHTHHCEEEWLYILSGRGIAEIDGGEYEVGPGDFMGFPTPSVGHHLRNPFAEELVYLSGGESREVEIADYPRFGLRMVRRRGKMDIYRLEDGRGFAEIGVPEPVEAPDGGERRGDGG